MSYKCVDYNLGKVPNDPRLEIVFMVTILGHEAIPRKTQKKFKNFNL